MPRRAKPLDISVQVRLHRTTLATAAKFFQQKGDTGALVSMSALVRRSLEEFAKVLQAFENIAPLSSTHEAQEILEQLELVVSDPGAQGYNQRALVTNLEEDEQDSGESLPASRERQTSRFSEQEIRKQLRIIKQQEPQQPTQKDESHIEAVTSKMEQSLEKDEHAARIREELLRIRNGFSRDVD